MKNIALITGGSSGIGKAIAIELAQKGYHLLIVSNHQQDLDSTKIELEKKYAIQCYTYYLDLSKEHAANTLFEYCKTQEYEIDFLVNNAGILIFSELYETKDHLTEKILMLHMYTPTILCRLFSKEMVQKKKGYILNVSSISSAMPLPCISLYGPTKTYLRYFSKAIRVELSIHNIQVCCVLPGTTETALYDPKKVNMSLAKKIGIMTDATFVARKAVNATLSNKGEIIPGWINKLSVLSAPFLPEFIIKIAFTRFGLVTKFKNILDK